MNIGGTGATDNCLDAQITGQSDYDVNSDQTILVKMNRSSGRDLFLMYNKKTGINSGTVEGGDLVTVVEADAEGMAYGESWLVAKLGAGQGYTASNYPSVMAKIWLSACYRLVPRLMFELNMMAFAL
jgi:hypothetical protein